MPDPVRRYYGPMNGTDDNERAEAHAATLDAFRASLDNERGHLAHRPPVAGVEYELADRAIELMAEHIRGTRFDDADLTDRQRLIVTAELAHAWADGYASGHYGTAAERLMIGRAIGSLKAPGR